MGEGTLQCSFNHPRLKTGFIMWLCWFYRQQRSTLKTGVIMWLCRFNRQQRSKQEVLDNWELWQYLQEQKNMHVVKYTPHILLSKSYAELDYSWCGLFLALLCERRSTKWSSVWLITYKNSKVVKQLLVVPLLSKLRLLWLCWVCWLKHIWLQHTPKDHPSSCAAIWQFTLVTRYHIWYNPPDEKPITYATLKAWS